MSADSPLEARAGEATDRDPLLDHLVNGVEIVDLGRPMYAGMPQSADHVPYRLVIPRRHGDIVRADGSSGASEMIVTSGHVSTHVDALCHISYEGRLHGGIDAHAACLGGRFAEHGAETIAPMLARGLLLDIPAALGVECCEVDYEVTTADLEAALALTGRVPEPGDVLLVRTGHGQRFVEPEFLVGAHGAPGPGASGARWLADHRPLAVGSDTIAFEHLPAGGGDYGLPAHRLLIVERGVYIIEVLDLEDLARRRIHEFAFFLSPLKLVGATGSPARPLALVTRSRT